MRAIDTKTYARRLPIAPFSLIKSGIASQWGQFNKQINTARWVRLSKCAFKRLFKLVS